MKMDDRTVISREQWPPSSSTADRRRPHVRFPGASQRQDAHFSPETPSNSHDIQRSPSWSASEATDSSLHPKSRPQKKRVRAEDLWDRDEEELLRQRRAKELASSDLPAGSGEESQHDFMGPSELPQDPHSFGGVVDDLIHSHLVEDCGQAYTRPEGEALNYAEGNTLSGSLESQSSHQAYTQPGSDTLRHAEENIPPRSAEIHSHPDLKRPRDRYLDDFNTRDDSRPELQKRRRNSAGYTEPSTTDNDLPHQSLQDAIIDVLLKKLADEQGKTRAAKQELKRLQHQDKDREPKTRKKGKKPAAATKREKDRATQSYETTLAVDSPPKRKELGPPPARRGHGRTNRLAAFTKFESLPDNVQEIILGMLLKSPDPIKLNTARLVDFVKTNGGIPYLSSSTRRQKRRINVPKHEKSCEHRTRR
jgi:hypothetical protein